MFFVLFWSITNLIRICKSRNENLRREGERCSLTPGYTERSIYNHDYEERKLGLQRKLEDIMGKLLVERFHNIILSFEIRQERQLRLSQEQSERHHREHIKAMEHRELQWKSELQRAKDQVIRFEISSSRDHNRQFPWGQSSSNALSAQNRSWHAPGRHSITPVYISSQEPQPSLCQTAQVVVDGENVFLYGNERNEGNIRSVINYYTSRGKFVLVVLPHFRVNKKRNDGSWGIARSFESTLNEKSQLIPVPINADDDIVAIKLAKNLGAEIVSNDRYGNHIKAETHPEKKKELATFLREKRVSFKFKKGQYQPSSAN